MWLNEFYHATSPVALSWGPIVVRWYGLAYLAGFLLAGIGIYRIQRRWGLDLTSEDVIDIVLGVAFGLIIGARLAYVIFYGARYYLVHPLEVFAINRGGMSFHGGLVGGIVCGAIVCRRDRLSFLTMCDIAVCVVPIGLFLGRCANFVNGELWGKETTLPWGVMFDDTGGGAVYRHPSQLYEALLEGVVIFVVLVTLSKKFPPRPQGTFTGIFLVMYGCFRFLIEFVRLPDEQLGYLWGGFVTMGQLLSVPLIVAGIICLVCAHNKALPQVGHI